MTILYYSWQENSTTDILDTFRSLGHKVKLYVYKLSHYLSAGFADECSRELASCRYDLIFTFNYFSQISNTAEIYGVPYFSWIFDCPISLFTLLRCQIPATISSCSTVI